MHQEWGYAVDFGMLHTSLSWKDGGMLPTQIHVGYEPSREHFRPVVNVEVGTGRSYHTAGYDKPFGGFWTSTKNDRRGCDWLRFLRRDRFRHDSIERGGMAWEVKPKVNASVYVIADEDDYELLKMCYPYEVPVTGWTRGGGTHTDWEAVAKDFDAIHVKAWGCMEAWDCETVVWFNLDAIETVTACDEVQGHVQATIDYIDSGEWDWD